jgi:Neuraminidase (sialidase)
MDLVTRSSTFERGGPTTAEGGETSHAFHCHAKSTRNGSAPIEELLGMWKSMNKKILLFLTCDERYSKKNFDVTYILFYCA